MDITYRQLFKITIIFLIFFLVFGLYPEINAKAGFEKKLAVFIETPENKQTEPKSHSDFALSVKKLMEFKFINNKVAAEMYLVPKNSIQNSIQSLQISDYYGLVVINFSISDKQQERGFTRRVFKSDEPDISLHFSSTYSDIENDRIIKKSQTNFEAKSQRNWFETAEDEMDLHKQFQNKPEPVEYLIQRVVDSLTKNIPMQKMMFSNSDNRISAAFFIDSSFIEFSESHWLNKYENMILYSSHVLDRQFGHGLDVKLLVTANIRKDRSVSMNRLFRTLKMNEENLSERLIVYLINNNDRKEYFLSNRYDNIGLAEIGRNQILINEVPSPTLRQSEWQSMYNALTLLHEIGHTFGAVHVSDKYSIMNHNLTWLATNEFDPVNKQIVSDALSGKLTFVNKEDYLMYVTDLILSSEYYLVDIPSFYYNFFKRKSDSLVFQSLSQSEKYKPFLYAASGFGYLENRQFQHAESEFTKALEYLPTQASLYYYLSLCTEGETSKSYLTKAYQMGYYLAEAEFHALNKQ